MDLHHLVDHLDQHGARLRVRDGRLILTAPPHVAGDPDIVAAITANKVLLIAHVRGVATGHTLGFCTVCDAAVTTHYRPAGKHPKCRLRPGCSGRHEPRPVDVERLSAICAPAAPKQPPAPRKPPTKFLLGPRPPWPANTGSTRP